MVIDEPNQAAVYTLDGEHEPFCSTGCLLDSYERRRQEGQALPERVWLADFLTETLHPAEAVTFLLTENRPTVMGWGILAFADAETAAAQRRHEDEILTGWLGLRRLKGRPDRQLAASFGEQVMDPEVIDLDKGELLTLELRGPQSERELRIRVRGYEELGEILLPGSGEPRTVRFLAIRPGEGFPVIRVDDGHVLGRIRVHGAHTADEEAR
jgi:hypothetical protein